MSFCPLAPGGPERTGVFLFCLVPGTKTGAHNTLFHLGGSREWGRGGGGGGSIKRWRNGERAGRRKEMERERVGGREIKI